MVKENLLALVKVLSRPTNDVLVDLIVSFDFLRSSCSTFGYKENGGVPMDSAIPARAMLPTGKSAQQLHPSVHPLDRSRAWQRACAHPSMAF
jgi:hypothetical protein